MPPTFFIYFGFLIYLGVLTISLIIFLPMLSLNSKKTMAKSVIITVLISFPCLILTFIVFGLLFMLPAVIFFGLAHAGYISKEALETLLFTAIVIFTMLVSIAALYLWYVASKIMYTKIGNKPQLDFIGKEKVLKVIRPYLTKLQSINFFQRNTRF